MKRVLVTSALILVGFLAWIGQGSSRTHAAWLLADGKTSTPRLARLSETATIRVSSDNPYLNLSDGHEVLTDYEGPEVLREALERDHARPLSLASADFDEDGVPDLISGYAFGDSGIVTLLRGNVDAIYPNAPEAQRRRAEGTYTEAPFLSPAYVFSVPEAADFVGAGDFDGDSHWDVVAAAKGGDKLYLLSGDGRGELKQTRQVELPGKVTALTVGEINRRDGLDDVVVAVSGASGAKVLVYEGPEGAVRTEPEVFAAPEEVTSLALGQLDDSYEMDLAVAAGHKLMLVLGRDRRLSLDAERQREVKPARIEQRSFRFVIHSIAVGDFTGNHRTVIAVLGQDGGLRVLSAVARALSQMSGPPALASLALSQWQDLMVAENADWGAAAELVSAQLSSRSADNIVVIDRTSRSVEALVFDDHEVSQASASGAQRLLRDRLETETSARAILPMRLNTDALNDLVIIQSGSRAPSVVSTQAVQTFVVTTAADNGNNSSPVAGSLRRAIIDANANQGADRIEFRIGMGVQTIAPTAPLPDVIDPVEIDGTTQLGYAGIPIIELDGSNAGNANGLFISAGASTLRGLVINRFKGNGVWFDSKGRNIVQGNFIGTDVSGKLDFGNAFQGLIVTSAANNMIGGPAPAARNVVSGNNNSGVTIIGTGATGNVVQNNLLGTDVTGTADLGNTFQGVFSGDASLNSEPVTGAASGTTIAGNVISGNDRRGIWIYGSGATGNLVQGNLVGTDISGTRALGNFSHGVLLTDAPNNTIGGLTTQARNIVSGQIDASGIIIERSGSKGNRVEGNYIGTDVNGTAAIGNTGNGVGISVGASSNTIGGVTSNTRNIISGNHLPGVFLGATDIDGVNTSANQIQGNYIGSDATGTLPVPNNGGVLVGGFFTFDPDRPVIATNNTVGGSEPGAGNLISGNARYGVDIINLGSENNYVRGNLIGTDFTGTRPLPNVGSGILITRAPNNTIGGPEPGARNVISGNSAYGIDIGIPQVDPLSGRKITGGRGIKVSGNYIGTDISGTAALGNGQCGIFVDADSVTNVIENNRIAFNGSNGICIPNAAVGSNPLQIRMTSNLLWDNNGLGIDLGPAGPTSNPRNRDTGANNLQNFPELSSALISSRTITSESALATATVTVAGILSASPNTTYRLEFFLGETCQSGQGHQSSGATPVLLDTRQVSTGADGMSTYTFDLPLPATNFSSGWINATATDPIGNTSELSSCRQVSGTLPRPGPSITSVVKDGKNFVITGVGFADGARLLVNGEEKKARVDSPTSLFSKKGAKGVQLPAKIKVRNPDGSLSNEWTYQ